MTNENHGYSTRNLNGKEIQGRGCVCVCVCVCVADSLCSTVETDIAVKATTLQLRNIKWDEGLSYRTEPLTCGIWYCLQVGSFRIELSWCPTIDCVGDHPHTLEIGSRNFLLSIEIFPYGLTFGLSWKMTHVHLKSMCILLLLSRSVCVCLI